MEKLVSSGDSAVDVLAPSLRVVERKYPSLAIWRTKSKEDDLLKIINPNDFPEQDILNSLNLNYTQLMSDGGLNSICDIEEIEARQALGKFLLENPDVCKLLVGEEGLGSLLASHSAEIPEHDGQPFLNYFFPQEGQEKGPHNPHWVNVHKFLQIVEGLALPPRVEQFVSVLKGAMNLEQEEKEMAQIVREELEKVAFLAGVFEFRLEDLISRGHGILASCISHNTWGHQKYSCDLSTSGRELPPWWVRDDEWWKYFGGWVPFARSIARALVERRNKKSRALALDRMVLRSGSDTFVSEVTRAVCDKLNSLDLNKLRELLSQSKMDICEATLKAYAIYSNKGLQVHIFHVCPRISNGTSWDNLADASMLFEGYTDEEKRSVLEQKEAYERLMITAKEGVIAAPMMSQIQLLDPDFFRIFPAKSDKTDRLHRWFALSNVLSEQVSLKAVLREAKKHRHFFYNHLMRMATVVSVLGSLKKCAERLNTELYFPEIIGNGSDHVVSFEEIFPFKLLLERQLSLCPEKIVPIRNLPSLDSTIVIFTGDHGGGKTVTLESLAGITWLAQMGIPIPGAKNLRLNLKKRIGMLFINRGEGSLFERTTIKTREILERIKEVDGREILLLMDEIGTGTQAEEGHEIGMRILRTLDRKGVSLVSATQLQSLAKDAQTSLGAVCVSFDRKTHRITQGISGGNAKKLAKDLGLDSLLD